MASSSNSDMRPFHMFFLIVDKFVIRVLFRTKHKRFFSEPNTNSSFQNQTQTAPLASTKPEKFFKSELNYRIQCMSLNKNTIYFDMPRSTKCPDTSK